MEIITFVTVKGALQARDFYQEVFGAKQTQEITMLSNIKGFEDPKYEGLVGHMTLEIGTSKLFINDYLEEYPREIGDNIQLVVNFETEEELRKAYKLLSKEGQVIEELQEVFWGALFGTVKDRFGVNWQIYYGHK